MLSICGRVDHAHFRAKLLIDRIPERPRFAANHTGDSLIGSPAPCSRACFNSRNCSMRWADHGQQAAQARSSTEAAWLRSPPPSRTRTPSRMSIRSDYYRSHRKPSNHGREKMGCASGAKLYDSSIDLVRVTRGRRSGLPPANRGSPLSTSLRRRGDADRPSGLGLVARLRLNQSASNGATLAGEVCLSNCTDG